MDFYENLHTKDIVNDFVQLNHRYSKGFDVNSMDFFLSNDKNKFAFLLK